MARQQQLHGLTLSERFERYVDRSAGPNGCHLWTGAHARAGYGVLYAHGQIEYAHRLAYLFATGDRPEYVCHHCDVPACCNPAHLYGGDASTNNRDAVERGRHTYQTKLDAEQQRAAHAMHERGMSSRAIARVFDTSHATIGRVLARG